MSPKKKIVGAISPNDISRLKKVTIPQAAFDAFNELFTERLTLNGYAMVPTKDVISRMENKGLDADNIIAYGWLNIEPIYRQKGWKVEYHRPDPNENYDAYYTFEIPKNQDS